MSNDKTLATAKHGGCVQLGTPGSRWAASGEPDPQGTRYDCERAALVMGDLTDDELANAVFMHGNERQTMADLVGGATPAIAYLTAAKDRIRWLSRALAAAESLSAQPSAGGQDAAVNAMAERLYCAESAATMEDAREWAALLLAEALPYLAARQPDTDEQYADEQALIDHLDELMDDGGQGGEKWPPAQAAIAGIIAARQPVGEPVAWMTHHDEPMLFPTAAEAAAYCEDDEQPVPLFRSPAQAVDLGQLERFDMEGVPTSRGWDVVNNRDATGEWVRFDDVRALIDSQAVGK